MNVSDRAQEQVAADAETTAAVSQGRIKELEEQVERLTTAAIDRERNAAADVAAYQAAYTERVGYLEAQVATLTEAAIARERQAAADLEACQAACAANLAQLETRIADLTTAAVSREQQSKVQQETDYQLLMIHQNLLAEFRELEPAFITLYERCKPFTMTSVERLYSLYKCVEYISISGIPGDFAECGVWRGGSCMLMAFGLLQHGDVGRRIYMFDTFDGHPRPDSEKDVDLWGNRGIDEYDRRQAAGSLNEWGAAQLTEVRSKLVSTGYPETRLIFVKGMVEATVPENVPHMLALLRLDTDWYDSTRVALHHLYPKLVEGGVLIIDDYGHYRGQRQAVDEYFAEIGERPLLHRIDYSCRVMVKPHRRVTASNVATL